VSTSPVGAFPPNAYGLYDMQGNVLQWVADCFSPSYAGLPTDGSAYKVDVPFAKLTGFMENLNGKSSCSYRVLHGGCWADTPGMIRSAARNWAPPPDATMENYGSSGVGIRGASDLD
jgi:formylglycine-generating enzyme required for sulfatase activity